MYLKFRITFKFNLISLTLTVIFTYCAQRLDAVISVFYITQLNTISHILKKSPSRVQIGLKWFYRKAKLWQRIVWDKKPCDTQQQLPGSSAEEWVWMWRLSSMPGFLPIQSEMAQVTCEPASWFSLGLWSSSLLEGWVNGKREPQPPLELWNLWQLIIHFSSEVLAVQTKVEAKGYSVLPARTKGQFSGDTNRLLALNSKWNLSWEPLL